MTSSATFDHLDTVVVQVRKGDLEAFGPLSVGESIYVALAASRPDLLPRRSIVGALDRLGEEWMRELIARWTYG
jgi:hypothetical protein